MISHRPYLPSRDLVTEVVRVGVPLDTKRALVEAARRNGVSVSGLVREAVQDRILRDVTLHSRSTAYPAGTRPQG